MLPIVLAITGASGAIYGIRLLRVLHESGRTVHLTISPAAVSVIEHELALRLDLNRFDVSLLLSPVERPAQETEQRSGEIIYHHYHDYGAPIASGSFETAGMAICPCSLGTLAAVANGLSTNLIHRAADVHLKERRKLVLVPRETPLSTIQLGNMHQLSQTGAVILPAMPGFYHQPLTIEDMVDFIVFRICDQLGVSTRLSKRWGTDG